MAVVPLTPFVGGIKRATSDTVQTSGALRDAIGIAMDTVGDLSGLSVGPKRAYFSNTPRRWVQWGDKIVKLKDSSGGYLQINDGTQLGTETDTISTDGKAVNFSKYLAIGGTGQSRVLVDSTSPSIFASSYCFLGEGIGDDFGEYTSGVVGPSTYSLTFATIYPQTQSGKSPRYVLFDGDSFVGAISASIRTVDQGSIITAGTDITYLEYDGSAPPADATRAYLIFGDSLTDTLEVGGFFVYKDRLHAWKENKILTSGFPGFPSPARTPDPNDWTYWYALNYKIIGTPDDRTAGQIIRCVPAGGVIFVFLERGIAVVTGDPPINELENQLVVTYLSDTIGAVSYDAITVSPDGQFVFFVGIDGNLYTASAGGISTISSEIRKHERFDSFDYAVASENLIIFAGHSHDYTKVAREKNDLHSGYLMQFPSAFVYNVETQNWTSFVMLGTNSIGDLVPFDDPKVSGGFGLFEVDNKKRVGYGTSGGIVVLQDPEYGYTNIDRALCIGGSTHKLELGGSELKRVDSVVIQVRGVLSNRMSVAVPAEQYSRDKLSNVVRTANQRLRGDASVFEFFTQGGYNTNQISVAFGLWGERLVHGADTTPDVNLVVPITTGYLQKVSLIGDYVSRLDVLCHSVVSASLNIYENNETVDGDAIGDLIFTSTMTEPKTGHVSSTDWFWRTFEVRQTFESGKYWVKLSGSFSISSFSSASQIVNPAHTPTVPSIYILNRSFGMRLIRELGAPFAAQKITSIIANVKQIGKSAW